MTGLKRGKLLDRWAHLSPLGVFDALECRIARVKDPSHKDQSVPNNASAEDAPQKVTVGAHAHPTTEGATGASELGIGAALWSWWTGGVAGAHPDNKAGEALVGYSYAVELESAHWIVRVLIDEKAAGRQGVEAATTEMLLSHLEAAHKRNQEKGLLSHIFPSFLPVQIERNQNVCQTPDLKSIGAI